MNLQQQLTAMQHLQQHSASLDSKVSKTGDEDISGIKPLKVKLIINLDHDFGDMIPESDDTHSLSSVTNRFKHLFVGNSSIWMGEDHKINATDGKLRLEKENLSAKKSCTKGRFAQAIAFAQSNSSATTRSYS